MVNKNYLKLADQLCFAVYACSKELIRLYRPRLDKLGITYTQYITLLVLWEIDPIPLKELCNRLYLDSGTMTPVLKAMEKSGLLTRQRMANDERQVSIALTKQGQDLKEQATTIPLQMLSSAQLSHEEAKTLKDSLHQLLKQLPHT
jgi:DNA-binding MarR family transcriptional regulator